MKQADEFTAILQSFPVSLAAITEAWRRTADLRHRVHNADDRTLDAKSQRQLRAVALALDDFHRAVKHCEDDTDPDDDIPF